MLVLIEKQLHEIFFIFLPNSAFIKLFVYFMFRATLKFISNAN